MSRLAPLFFAVMLASGCDSTAKAPSPSSDDNKLIVFTADWCASCQELKKVMASAKVAKALETYSVVVYDQTKETKEALLVAKEYGVSRLPFVVKERNGQRMAPYGGVVEASDLLNYLK